MMAQLAFRDIKWQTWSPPIRLEGHQLTANLEAPQ